LKCWNCEKEIVRSENWTPTNRIWIEDYHNNPKIHNFKKCYHEKQVREGKEFKIPSEEQLIHKEEEDDIPYKSIRYWNFEVHCYYCDFTTRVQNTYEEHVLTEHWSKQPQLTTIKTDSGQIFSIRTYASHPCYPALVDLKLLGIKPHGYYWEGKDGQVQEGTSVT
jgi:hypothetical protein